MLFKLLRGYHRDWSFKFDRDTRQRTTVKRMYSPGESVESDRDLCKLFNRPGSIKFERLPDPPQAQSFQGQQNAVATAVKESPDLDGMTVRDLQALAEEEEIDLGGAKTKDQMVKTIRQATGG